MHMEHKNIPHRAAPETFSKIPGVIKDSRPAHLALGGDKDSDMCFLDHYCMSSLGWSIITARHCIFHIFDYAVVLNLLI